MKSAALHQEGFFKADKGDELYYQSYAPKKSKAHLILVHGMAEYSDRYLHFVDYFNRKGFAVHLFDLRGHGKSPGPRCFAESFGQLVEDLANFIEKIHHQVRPAKIFLVAHSFGGQIAVNYLAKYPKRVAGAILSAPNLKLKMHVPWHKKAAARTLAKFFPKISLGNEINPESISRDPKVVQHYRNDPQIQKRMTLRLGAEVLNNLDCVMSLAKKIKDPILLLHGEADPIASSEGSRNFYKKLNLKDRNLKIYPSFLHEIFNEIGKEQVFSDVEKWLEKRVS